MQSYGNLPNWQIFLAAFRFFNNSSPSSNSTQPSAGFAKLMPHTYDDRAIREKSNDNWN